MINGPHLVSTAAFRLPLAWTCLGACVLLATTFSAFAQPPKKAAAPRAAESKTDAAAKPDDDEGDSAELPKLDEMPLPSFERLLQGPAMDWLVLKTQRVIEVEPLHPRPGTLEDIERQVKETFRLPAQNEEGKARRKALANLPITLLEGDAREFKIAVRMIREIIYFEDLMLRRIDRLLDDRRAREAYDLLIALHQRAPHWAGLAERQQRLLFIEAAVRRAQNDWEAALVLLEELHHRNRDYDGLLNELGTVAEHLINAAATAADYRRARHFLKCLRQLEPKHGVVTRWSQRFEDDARQLLARAAETARTGPPDQALDLAERAALIWPDLADLPVGFRNAATRYPRLRAGVSDVPRGRPSRLFPAPADRRQHQFTQVDLFQPARVEEQMVRYETPLFDEWEPTDLGHGLLFQLRRRRAQWESPLVATAGVLADTIAARIDPHHPDFDERFASFVERVTVHSPFELSVRFAAAPLRPEALFAFPARPAVDAPAERAGYPFQIQALDEHHAVYRRAFPEPATFVDRHIAEVIETVYESDEHAVQGLLRGEVSLLPHVAAWHVPQLAAHPDFITREYALPQTHLIRFNPRRAALANRTLRRALVYGLDRRRILETVFLRGPAGRLGRLTSSPVPTTSYAYNSFVEPHKFDAGLGLSLAIAAKKELGHDIPALKLLCPRDPLIEQAAQQVVDSWRKIGVTAGVVVPGDSERGPLHEADWDLAWGVVSLAEPLVEIWPCLTPDGATDVESLTSVPAWLRHELLSLDQAGDRQSAAAILHRLHKELWAEVHLIPLWELSEFLAARKTVRGIPQRPMAAYQHIERWKVDAWYSKE